MELIRAKVDFVTVLHVMFEFFREVFWVLTLMFSSQLVQHQINGEEWLASLWTVPALYQGSPSVCCQCPWKINTNVSSVSRSWGNRFRLSVAIASVFTASSSSPGRPEVLRPPTSIWSVTPHLCLVVLTFFCCHWICLSTSSVPISAQVWDFIFCTQNHSLNPDSSLTWLLS